MEKAKIRILYKKKRQALTVAERTARTIAMTGMLMDFLKGKSIDFFMSFLPMEHLNEIDTAVFEKAILNANPEAKVLYPRISGDEMEAVYPLDPDRWTLSRIGVREHSHYEVVAPEKISLVLVPLLAMDRQGFRVGYGKGYYDGFLSKTNALTVGLSFFEPIDSITDLHQSDVALQYGLYPGGLLSFPH